MFVAVDGALAGMLAIADPVRATSAEAIRALRERGLQVVLLTGDRRDTADAVARQVGIDVVEAQVSPDRKLDVVRKYQEQGRHVAMVGDGLNDAPALAQADLGIAMGGGTDVALETASVTLLRNDLRSVPDALALVKQTMRVIRQNLGWAFVYNIVCIPVAAGVLYPVLRPSPHAHHGRRRDGAQQRQRGRQQPSPQALCSGVLAIWARSPLTAHRSRSSGADTCPPLTATPTSPPRPSRRS